MDESQAYGVDPQQNKMKLWNIHFINTLAVTLIVNISSIILITLLPLYTASLGGNNIIAGTLTTIFTMSALLFRPIFGKMLDLYGRRIILIAGLCFFAFSTVLLVMATNITVVFILRFIQGIGLSAYSTALGTVLSDVVPKERISEGIGYFGIAATVAMAIGPALGLYLCDMFGYHITYTVAFGITLISAVVASFIKYEKKASTKHVDVRQKDEVSATVTKTKGQGFIEKTAIRPCIVLLFVVFGISAVFSFMPLFAKERNIENIGLFFTVYAISMIITRLVTGRIADRFGHLVVYLPAVAITFLLFVILAFAYSLPAVLIAAICYGVGYGTIQPIMNTMVIKLSPQNRRGAANATYYATMDIGFGLGSFIWGSVSQAAGFTVVFLSGAACVVISVFAYFLILHSRLKGKYL